jgi:hypothetical protein
MTCPPEIARIVLQILQTGMLRIRASAWSKENDRCAVEADHLHNLPDLLNQFSWERLQYYWDVERLSFVRQSPPAEQALFEPLWNQLARHVTDLRNEQADRSQPSTQPV